MEEAMLRYKMISTPLGKMVSAEYSGKICLLEFADDGLAECLAPLERKYKGKAIEDKTQVLAKLEMQLSEYFAGKRKVFNLPLEFSGTEFQKSVWQKLLDIPFG